MWRCVIALRASAPTCSAAALQRVCVLGACRVLPVQGPEELVWMGLRVLESWVDNVNPEFLEQVRCAPAPTTHTMMGLLL